MSLTKNPHPVEGGTEWLAIYWISIWHCMPQILQFSSFARVRNFINQKKQGNKGTKFSKNLKINTLSQIKGKIATQLIHKDSFILISNWTRDTLKIKFHILWSTELQSTPPQKKKHYSQYLSLHNVILETTNTLFFFSSNVLGVTVLEGPIYAVGGHDGWSYLNTVERWDPQSQQWTYVASMSIARSTVGVAALNGKWVYFPVIFNRLKRNRVLVLKNYFEIKPYTFAIQNNLHFLNINCIFKEY